MINENIKKSILIYALALSTAFFVWFVLYYLASNSTNAYDPNPWIQEMVDKPRTISPQSSDLQWVSIVQKQGKLIVDSTQQIPLSEWKASAEKIIFLVEAQGPTAASELYHFLKDSKLDRRSLILSSSDGFLKDLRFYDAELTLGAGQAYLVRYRALQEIGLHGFLTIAMSGVWIKPEIFKESTQKLTDTFQQQRVAVFIGPIDKAAIPSLPQNANFLVK